MNLFCAGQPTARGRWTAVVAILSCLAVGAVEGQEGAVGTGGVKGTVKDTSGLAVEGARIFVTGSTLAGESGSNGEFVLAKANAGPLTIHVRRLGFAHSFDLGAARPRSRKGVAR